MDVVFDENEVSIAWLAVLTVERLKPIQEDSVVFATEPKCIVRPNIGVDADSTPESPETASRDKRALVLETQTPETHMVDPRMRSTPSWGATLNELH
ncbi:exo-betaglucanase [Colletotrichum higginsianum]|nr:exo-betaglucanase [Colletotrichum higginsianum]